MIAYGVSHFDNGPIYSWQLLFLILGLATVFWACWVAYLLPDSPMRAKCFTEDEKKLLVERVRRNEMGIQNKEYKRYQVFEALSDPLVWCMIALILVANLVIGGLGVFSNLIISNFGFTVLQTQLLNIAQGAITICVMVGSAWVTQKWQQTCWTMLVRETGAVLTIQSADSFRSYGRFRPSWARPSLSHSNRHRAALEACLLLSTARNFSWHKEI